MIGFRTMTLSYYTNARLNDGDTFWLILFPELIACLVFVLSKNNEDCFHCFNRIKGVAYSMF